MTSAADVAFLAGKHQRVAGGQLICCPSPHHDDRTPSCKVFDGPDGEAMFHCFSGCDWREVRTGAEALGLIPAWQPTKPATISSADHRKLERRRRHRERAQVRDSERRRKWAKAIWDNAVEIADTPAAAYLASRNIQPAYPAILRFTTRTYHSATETW